MTSCGIGEHREAALLCRVRGDETRPRGPVGDEGAEAPYREIVATAVDAIALIDEDGTILTFNPAAEEIFGYPAREVVGRPASLLLRDPIGATRDLYLAAGGRRIVDIGRDAVGRRKDGSAFPLDLSAAEWVDNGRRFVTATMRDGTLRRQAEADLRDLGARLSAVLESTADSVILVDRAWRISFANGQARGRFGRAGGDPVGTGLWDFWPRDDGDRLRRMLEDALERQAPQAREVFIAALATWLEIRAHPWDGGLALFVRDIGERKEAERQRQILEHQLRQSSKMAALGRLASGISHDFNNLLLAMGNMVALAADTLPEAAEAREHLALVSQAVERAGGLVGQILAFCRQEEPRRERVRLSRVIAEVLDLVQTTIPATIALRPRLAYRGSVLGDPVQLHQIVVNLAMNAADAIGRRPGTIAIDLDRAGADDERRLSLPAGDYVRLVVRDDGAGMSAEVLERAFEPFFTTKKAGEGTGLGLAIVHGIVTAHGGAILVDSRPGAGTAFTIYLPRPRRDRAGDVAGLAMPAPGREP